MFSTVRAKLWLLVSALTGALLFLAVYSFSALVAVKIGSPVYQRIVDSMTLRADILPPPQYLVETELTVYELADRALLGNVDKAYSLAELKLLNLRRQFEDGQRGWGARLPEETDLDREIHANLLGRNGQLGRRYFALVFGEFLPAIKQGNRSRVADLLHGPLREIAAQHRAVIDNLMAFTEKGPEQGERTAQAIILSRLRAALCVISLVVFIAFAYATLVIRSITRPLHSAIVALDKFAEGDLTVSAQTDATGELGRMCSALNRAIESLRHVIAKGISSAENLGEFSKTLSSVSVSVSAGIQHQVSALKETASNVGLIADISANNALGTVHGIDSATRTRTAADRGSEVAKAALAGMVEIQGTSAQITQIVGTIDEIGFYTNLLAVNAAVEAAGAGEQGRGFMIVAQEIRGLAQRTAKAADRIRQLVDQSKSAIAAGAEKVQQSSQWFESVSTAARELSAIMEDVATSTNVQSDSLKQVTDTVAGVANSVDKSNLGTEKIGATSKELAIQADELQKLAEFFKV